MRFDLLSLNLVLAIAETGSLTRAAEREHLALAAASKRLSDLEARLGVVLFERRARGVEITDAGRALVRHIRSLNASLHALESEVVEYARGLKGHLRLAANASAIAECLPPPLAAFTRAHPLIRISLEDMTSAEVQAAVAEGHADVGIFVPPLLEPQLATRPWRRGTLAVIVPAGHELADAASVRFESLLDYDLVGLHVGAAVQEFMREQASERGRVLNTRLQVHGFDAIAQLVGAGLGVAILPAVVAERFSQLFDLQVLTLDEAWAEREYQIAVRSQQRLPALVQRFIDSLAAPAPAAGASSTLIPTP